MSLGSLQVVVVAVVSQNEDNIVPHFQSIQYWHQELISKHSIVFVFDPTDNASCVVKCKFTLTQGRMVFNNAIIMFII